MLQIFITIIYSSDVGVLTEIFSLVHFMLGVNISGDRHEDAHRHLGRQGFGNAFTAGE